MTEPVIPKSMHDAAVEASRRFGRHEAEREALRWLAAIVEAAGGRIEVSLQMLVDPADVFESENLLGSVVFTSRRPEADSAETAKNTTKTARTASA